MAGKKYSDIYKSSNTSSVANTDLIAVERADGNTYVLQANVLYRNLQVSGPYVDDAAAATGNVSINQLYYDSTGSVKIRLT